MATGTMCRDRHMTGLSAGLGWEGLVYRCLLGTSGTSQERLASRDHPLLSPTGGLVNTPGKLHHHPWSTILHRNIQIGLGTLRTHFGMLLVTSMVISLSHRGVSRLGRGRRGKGLGQIRHSTLDRAGQTGKTRRLIGGQDRGMTATPATGGKDSHIDPAPPAEVMAVVRTKTTTPRLYPTSPAK